MKVNWIVRIKNKAFWIAIIPAILLLVQQVLGIFGVQLDFGEIGNSLLDVVNTVFVVLALLGVVNDPTTAGITDSLRAQSYTKPRRD